MTGKMVNFDGIPVMVPNDITDVAEDFYISYNDRSIGDYGCATTALVTEEPVKFLVLNGDHRKEYNSIISNGGNYEDCVRYFRDNENLKNKYSENYDELLVFEEGKLVAIKDDRFRD